MLIESIHIPLENPRVRRDRDEKPRPNSVGGISINRRTEPDLYDLARTIYLRRFDKRGRRVASTSIL